MIELGSYARDIVTGFSGLVTARTEFLFAGPDVRLQPDGLTEDGRPREALWFCEAQVEVVVNKSQIVTKNEEVT